MTSPTGLDLMAGPRRPTSPDPAASRAGAGANAVDVVRRHRLAARVVDARAAGRRRRDEDTVTVYAYARRLPPGLDLLRRNGWKGHGPIPMGAPRPNRGFLMSLALLALAARAISEDSEWERCSSSCATPASPPGRR